MTIPHKPFYSLSELFPRSNDMIVVERDDGEVVIGKMICPGTWEIHTQYPANNSQVKRWRYPKEGELRSYFKGQDKWESGYFKLEKF